VRTSDFCPGDLRDENSPPELNQDLTGNPSRARPKKARGIARGKAPRASPWVGDPEALARLMARVACEGGFTQMRKVLTHARRESKKAKVNAVVYVGDCIEEDIDELCGRAGELALLGVPMFLFQEGREPRAERAFKEIARLTRGAYCHFDAGSARQLRELLAAVAVYATGGRKALQDYGAATKSGAAVRLLEQLS